MMKYLYLILIIITASCAHSPQKEQSKTSNTFYVGTYTNEESKGIYKYELLEEGQMKSLGLMAEADNPSFLHKSITGTYLVVVNEVSDENQEGSVQSYKILEDSLVLTDQKSSGGAHPCHVSVNDEDFIVVSNYSGGNIALLKLDEKGMLEELDVKQHIGRGTNENRQEGPHAHSAYFFPGQHQVISADLGTNELWFSEINLENTKLENSQPNLKLPDGAGPRHLCFHPNKKWIYVMNELHGSITQVELRVDGNYQTRSTISTLQKDYSGENYSADIHISSDGKFVYASNRGPNEIAIFKVDEKTGSLTLLSHQSTHGNWPRNFTFSPDENFILVAHQYSSNICCFKRDAETGLLELASKTEAPNPVCLLF